jgi:chaperonin cofactor prefoldin
MESEHKKVTKKLNEMNDQYSSQLSENEKLRF